MRVYHRRKWDVTHSLTPSLAEMLSPKKQLLIPEIPERKQMKSRFQQHYSINPSGRSKKQRLIQQKNTQIQKSNRMLYEKIRKIMQKGHSSQKKVQPAPQQEITGEQNQKQFLNTSIKPFSLPHISSTIETLRTTQSELSHILDDRSKYAQKYFADLLDQRQKLKNIHAEELGNFVCFGWKVKVLLLDHGQFLVLKGRRAKKEITKKYIYQRIKQKIKKSSLQAWVAAKFEFQI